jgi:hypothetical protein
MMMMSISPFGPVGCGRPLRVARRRNIQPHTTLRRGFLAIVRPGGELRLSLAWQLVCDRGQNVLQPVSTLEVFTKPSLNAH